MILYDDNTHRYYDTEGDFISVTTLLNRYKNPFDAEVMSEIVASKRGGTAEEWKEKWKEGGQKAADRGHEFHAIKEEVEMNTNMTFANRTVGSQNQWLLLQLKKDWNYLKDLPDGGYSELMLWHKGYRIAGRADKCLIETVNGKRFLHIDDHKTNEKPMETESYRDKKTGLYKMMKPPLGRIMDCKLRHYELQLSMYQFLAESMGFLPGERRILHYGLTQFELVQGKSLTLEELLQREPQVYPVKYLKKEVLSVCTDYLKTLKRA
jgi:hypothetical protein